MMLLKDCVSDPNELATLNKKDIARLKAVVKRLIDERTELKYKVEEAFAYTLHFVQAGENRSHHDSTISAAKQ